MFMKRKIIVNSMIWLCVTLFYCYQYILRILPNIIMPELMVKFGIVAPEFANFASIYYIGYIVVHIPIGIALSRFGSRLSLSICILLSAIGLIPLIYTSNWSFVLIGRLLTGIGSSAAIVGALQIYRNIYPKSFTRMLGLTVCFGLMTIVYISAPLTKAVSQVGISASVHIILIIGLVLTIVSFCLLPKTENSITEQNIWIDIKSTLINYKIIIVSILAGLMVGPLEGFGDAWGTAFIIKLYGFDRTVSGSIIGTIFSGMCIGSIIIPFIADKTNSHYLTTLLSASVMGVLFIYLLSSGNKNLIALEWACRIIGIFCAYQIIIIAKISSFVPERLSAIAASIANMIIMAFGPIFHKSIGYIANRSWDGEMSDGMPVYSANDYISAITIIPAAMAIAIIGFAIFMVKDRKKNL